MTTTAATMELVWAGHKEIQAIVTQRCQVVIGVSLGKSQFPAFLDLGLHPNHNRIEHFTVTECNQLEKSRELGFGFTHTIGHVLYWGQAFKTRVLGCERAHRIDPVKEDMDKNLLFSFHSDSPVTAVDSLLYVQTAVTRQMHPSGGKVLGSEQRVSLEVALLEVTINPAKQVLMEDTIGSLEVGKYADLVILDKDPRSVSLSQDKISELVVEETWVGWGVG